MCLRRYVLRAVPPGLHSPLPAYPYIDTPAARLKGSILPYLHVYTPVACLQSSWLHASITLRRHTCRAPTGAPELHSSIPPVATPPSSVQSSMPPYPHVDPPAERPRTCSLRASTSAYLQGTSSAPSALRLQRSLQNSSRPFLHTSMSTRLQLAFIYTLFFYVCPPVTRFQ